MAKSIAAFSVPVTTLNFGDVRHFAMANNSASGWASSESAVNVDAPVAMTVSKVKVGVTSNTLSGGSDSVVSSRINSADGNLSVSIPNSTTGYFEDVTNSDSISVGDDVCWKMNIGGTSGTIGIHSIAWLQDISALTNHYSAYISTVTSADRYLALVGGGSGTSTETSTQLKAKTTGQFEKAHLIVEANSTSSDVTVRLRKNSANGNIAITVPAGTTGRFSDASNTDSVAVDDLFNWGKIGGNSAAFTARVVVAFVASSIETFMICGGDSTNSPTVSKSLTRYSPMSGRMSQNTAPDDSYIKMPSDSRISYLSAYLSSNSVGGGASTLSIYINGANGNQQVSIASLTSGWFHDTTNTDDVNEDDLVCYKLVTNTGGTNMRPTQYQALIQDISGTNYVQDVSEAITAVDSLSRGPAKNVQEAVTLVDSLTRGTARSLSENATVVDSISYARGIGITLVETALVIDSIIRGISRSFAEAIALVDDVGIVKILVRFLEESVSAEDSITRSIGKALGEVSSINDTIARAISRPFEETLIISASLSKGFDKMFDEAISLSDAISRGVGKGLSETVSAIARFSVFLDGILQGIWAKRPRITGSWSNVARIVSSWTKIDRDQ